MKAALQKITLMYTFEEPVISSTFYQGLLKMFCSPYTYDFEQA